MEVGAVYLYQNLSATTQRHKQAFSPAQLRSTRVHIRITCQACKIAKRYQAKPLGLFAIWAFSRMNLATRSDRIWFPPPQTMSTGMMKGCSPFMASSTHSYSALCNISKASSLEQPCKSRVLILRNGFDFRRLHFDVLYRCVTSPTSTG